MSIDKLIQQAADESGVSNVREKEIRGRRYAVKILPATSGLELGERIIEAAGPAIGVILDRKVNDGYIAPGEDSLYTEIMITVSKQLYALGLATTVKQLFKGLTCDDKVVDFDQHFAGNYGELLAVLEYAVEENFGGFFTEYLSAKGLGIHSVTEFLQLSKAETLPESSNESQTPPS